jgi:hypothetical protein
MHGGEVVAKVTSRSNVRLRSFGIVLAVVATTALVASPVAFGAEDTVASGKLALKYSSGFKKQLKKNGVKLKPKSFSINGGKLDPTTGTGTVNLKGKLTFKKGGKKLVYKKLTAKLGSGGFIKGSSGKVFKVKGGKVARNGFGANVTGLKLSFLKSAAKKVNKKLELDSLKKGKAGTASANNVQPEEVTLTSGSSELKPDLATFAKFAHHCISPLTGGTTGTVGILPIAPATSTAAPSFVFPVSGGDISPTGTSGAANSSGGIQITENILNDNAPAPGSNCSAINLGTASQIKQTDLVLDLTTKQIQAHILISGTESTLLDGDKGVAFIGTIAPGAVTTNPSTRTVSFTDAPAAFNATSAQVLNGSFPCDGNSGFSPNPADGGCTPTSAFRFVAGDPIGTVSFTGQAQ